jgi:hypothetical protein
MERDEEVVALGKTKERRGKKEVIPDGLPEVGEMIEGKWPKEGKRLLLRKWT